MNITAQTLPLEMPATPDAVLVDTLTWHYRRDDGALSTIIGQAATYLRERVDAEAKSDKVWAGIYSERYDAYRHSALLVAATLVSVPWSDKRWSFGGVLWNALVNLVDERVALHRAVQARRDAENA